MRKVLIGSSSNSSSRSRRRIWKRLMAWWRIIFRIFVVLVATASIAAFTLATSISSSDSAPRLHDLKTRSRGFWIEDDMFWKDGHPFQIIGGDVHYFRIVPQYWKDRLLRAKGLGLNTIQTYVPWNLHEPLPQKWDFDEFANVESYLRVAQKLGLLIMLRVGPYICGEWDLGGFPAWLLAIEPPLKLRSSDPPFLQLVERWWQVLLPKIKPMLYANGGPVIMIQIENEFGSYGDDKTYLHHLVDLARRLLGDDVILYTTDGGTRDTLEHGTIQGSDVYAAVDFSTGEDAWSIFQLQKNYNAPRKSPPLTAEFYTGWLTHWGEQAATTDASYTAAALEKILSRNGSAVLYMAHGGTNFGFFSGANTGTDESDYKADLTSYDYDAPIKEWGSVDNPKFKALQSVIKKYSKVSLPLRLPNSRTASYGNIHVSKISSIFEVLDSICDPIGVAETEQPMAMESAGQMFGFSLYISQFSRKENESILSISKVHDRAQVFVSCTSDDGPRYVGTIERWSNKAIIIPKMECSSDISLFILVENMGRINYGRYMYDRKGILSSVLIDGLTVHSWKFYPISLQKFSNSLKIKPIVKASQSTDDEIPVHTNPRKSSRDVLDVRPSFYEGRFYIEPTNHVQDSYISLRGWTKGVAFVNNFNIGRFWPSRGPQCSLYVPAPILKHGENTVVILELYTPNPELSVSLVDTPDFTCGSTALHGVR